MGRAYASEASAADTECMASVAATFGGIQRFSPSRERAVRKLILASVFFVIGALVGIFAQPYFPAEWTNWIDGQQVRVDQVVQAVAEGDDVGDKAKAAVEAVSQR